MGACASSPGPVQLTLRAGKAAAAVTNRSRSDEVKGDGNRGSCQQLPWECQETVRSSPALLLRRACVTCRVTSRSSSKSNSCCCGCCTDDVGVSADGAEGDKGAEGNGGCDDQGPQFPGSVVVQDDGAAARASSDGLSTAIPAEPLVRELPALTAQQDSPASRQSATLSFPVQVQRPHAQGARVNSASDQVMSLVMLQYRDLRPEDFELLSHLDEGIPRRGTAPSNFIHSLVWAKAADCGATDCRVCLGALAPDARLRLLPCQHGFHHDCILRWATEYRGACPLCGTPVVAGQTGTSSPLGL